MRELSLQKVALLHQNQNLPPHLHDRDNAGRECRRLISNQEWSLRADKTEPVHESNDSQAMLQLQLHSPCYPELQHENALP
ncbi:hypothetical protein TNIN_290341 [Trichonephila inaurata madagascariensis]|uniref:Uncharacterized protein n=1 Tax=Trichonephila inaurata madagascariensis TaxID=2747483 RepID=A0A8X7CJ86_9ARAC|nr:hypothetical protein TNIN_290341 [Trichonephila inaurata madagascariensis]